MTEDITSLQIRIESGQVQEATLRLNLLTRAGRDTENQTRRQATANQGLTSTLLRMAGAYVSLRSVVGGFNAIVQQTRQFQILRANLETATGSVQGMEKAWSALVDFAAKTPFSLDQSVEAFTRLVNYGLTPSERAMKSYGDTAAATSKQFTQMVEAVADAVNGEFERAKEAFNVKAKNMGDTVAFRFRGVTTEVKNNAKAIEEYFIKLGEANFEGGMARRMETLDGAISNLGDTWNQLLFDLGNTGIADAAEEGIRDLTEALEELRAYINSGAFEKDLEAWGEPWQAVFSSIATSAQDVGKLLNDWASEAGQALAQHAGDVEEYGQHPWRDLEGIIQGLPAAIRMFAQIGGAELETFAAKATQALGGLKLQFENWAEQAGASFDSFIKDNVNPSGLNPDSRFAGPRMPGTGAPLPSVPGYGDLFSGSHSGSVLPDLKEQNEREERDFLTDTDIWIQDAEAQAKEKWDTATGEYGDTMAKQKAARDAADAARAGYDPDANKPTGDRTAEFGRGVESTSNSSGKKGGGSKKAKESEFERLVKQLSDEEAAINESYARRLEVIKAATTEGTEYQGALSLTLLEKWQEDQQERIDSLKREPETWAEAMLEEERLIEESYERRKEIILSITEATEAERLELMNQAQQEYSKQMAAHNKETLDKWLDGTKTAFDNLASMGSTFGKKGFQAAKAAGIASATIEMYSSAVAAYRQGTTLSPYAGPIFAAAAIAAGAANIAKISSQQYDGAHAIGGAIPAGSFGLVGEAGPEFVRGPAFVTSAQGTKDRMGSGSGGADGWNIVVNNYGNESVQQDVNLDSRTVTLIIGEAVDQSRRAVAADIKTGGNDIANAAESIWRVKR